MTAEARSLHVDGHEVRLAGERWDGDPDRMPVVLLHGGGQTRHSWKRTGNRLAARGRMVLALDARGHGDSEWHPEGDYTMDGFVADLLEVVATLPRSPLLVGASLGGMTALLAAGEHPGVARGLVAGGRGGSDRAGGRETDQGLHDRLAGRVRIAGAGRRRDRCL